MDFLNTSEIKQAVKIYALNVCDTCARAHSFLSEGTMCLTGMLWLSVWMTNGRLVVIWILSLGFGLFTLPLFLILYKSGDELLYYKSNLILISIEHSDLVTNIIP